MAKKATVKKPRRHHPLTPAQRKALDDLRDWGEKRIEMEFDKDLHWRALVPIAKRALEVGISPTEAHRTARLSRSEFYRRIVWEDRDAGTK